LFVVFFSESNELSFLQINQALNDDKPISSNEIWQLKLFRMLMGHKLMKQEAKLSMVLPEILKSLLLKIKVTTNKQIIEQKRILKQIIVQNNLDFLQRMDMATVAKILMLANYFELPLALYHTYNPVKNVNVLQFLLEFKKRHPTNEDSEFPLNLWKILSK
jgi:hypothetical protein